MRKPYASLIKTEVTQPVDPVELCRFDYILKRGVLLALREQEILTKLQLRLAMEELEADR